MTGTSILHYQIVEKLGEGGMGVVYKARDTKLNRFVALKLLPPGPQSRELRERFLNEARTASSLGHPNIVTIHDILEHEGRDCIVMEFIPGKTLEQILQQGPPRLRDGIDYAVQTADALAAAHRVGLIHRDLKPGNVMVTPDGLVKVVDFGLAKLAAPAEGDDQAVTRKALTSQGTILGTPAYMSPEQAEGRKLDARSDIFSFGAVLYEIITGKRAFQGESRASTLAAILREDPLPLHQQAPTAPRGLDLVAGGCLRKDPTKRFQHMSDVRMILERVREEIDTSSRGIPQPAAALPAVRRKWLLPVLAAGALLVTGVGAGYLLRARSSDFSSAKKSGPTRLNRLTAEGFHFNPVLSPDGNLIVYSKASGATTPGLAILSQSGGGTELWIQPARGGTGVRLSSGEARNVNPRFSADGSKVYFSSSRTPHGIYEVPVLGGEPRLVIPDAGLVAPSPDGKSLAYKIGTRLFVRPVEGGSGRLLNETTIGGSLLWSPDSTRLLTVVERGDGPGQAAVVQVDDGTVSDTGLFRNLMERGVFDANFTEPKAWLPNDEIVICAPMGAAFNLWRLPLARLGDAEPVPISNGVGFNCQASFSGNRMAFLHSQFTNGIWSLGVDLNRGKVTGELVRLTPEGVEAQFPDLRPDNSALAYISRTGSGQGVFVLDLQSGARREVAMSPTAYSYSTFSPDGTKVAFGSGGGGWPAFTVSVAGGEPTTLGNTFGRVRGWSHDGRYLLIWRAVPRVAVGVFDIVTGKATETIGSNSRPLVGPRFSPDAKWVAFSAGASARETAKLFLAPFRGSRPVAESEWIPVAENGKAPFWSPDGRSLYYLGAGDESLLRLPLDSDGKPAGPPTEFYRLDKQRVAGLLVNTITANSNRLAMVLFDGPSSIWMMEHPW